MWYLPQGYSCFWVAQHSWGEKGLQPHPTGESLNTAVPPPPSCFPGS